jgi:PPOX class probable F420-dependent enzyme
MPKMTSQEIADFLNEPGHLVRIGTVDADGFPRVVPLWFVHQDGAIVFTPRAPAAFLANLRRDPKVGLSIDEDPHPYRKLTIQGTCQILHEPGEDDRWRDLYRRIARRYVTADRADAYVDNTDDQPRALVAVPLGDARVSSWRMPASAAEARTGIWARRYYAEGTRFAAEADQTRA